MATSAETFAASLLVPRETARSLITLAAAGIVACPSSVAGPQPAPVAPQTTWSNPDCRTWQTPWRWMGRPQRSGQRHRARIHHHSQGTGHSKRQNRVRRGLNPARRRGTPDQMAGEVSSLSPKMDSHVTEHPLVVVGEWMPASLSVVHPVPWGGTPVATADPAYPGPTELGKRPPESGVTLDLNRNYIHTVELLMAHGGRVVAQQPEREVTC